MYTRNKTAHTRTTPGPSIHTIVLSFQTVGTQAAESSDNDRLAAARAADSESTLVFTGPPKFKPDIVTSPPEVFNHRCEVVEERS